MNTVASAKMTTSSGSAHGSRKPAPLRDEKYFTPKEVQLHNYTDDLWMSWHGNVYNLSSLCIKFKGDPLLIPIIKNAGKDVSHWFDLVTGDIKPHINLLTGCKVPYTPEGRFLDVPPPLPRNDWKNEVTIPWWKNKEIYYVGKLANRPRKIIIVNTLTKDQHIVEVCREEKLGAIQERYSANNAHAKGYMWKRLGVLLDMTLTLEANGIKDEAPLFESLHMDEEEWLPVIHLYFSDDLTIA